MNVENTTIDYKIWHYFYGPFFQFNGPYYINAIRKNPRIYNSYFYTGLIGDIISGKHENISDNLDKLLIRSRDGSYINKGFIKSKYFYKALNENIKNLRRISFNDQEVAVRLKIQQLSFLISVPLHYGAIVLAPFTRKTIFRNIVSLEYNLKKGRLWQNKYFTENGINISPSRFLYFNYTAFKFLFTIPFLIRIKFLFLNFKFFGFSVNNLFFALVMVFPLIALPMFWPVFAKIANLFGISNPSPRVEKLFGIYFAKKKIN